MRQHTSNHVKIIALLWDTFETKFLTPGILKIKLPDLCNSSFKLKIQRVIKIRIMDDTQALCEDENFLADPRSTSHYCTTSLALAVL